MKYFFRTRAPFQLSLAAPFYNMISLWNNM